MLERFDPKTHYEPTSGLTETEDRQLVDLLKKMAGGRVSTPVFTELARIVPQPIVEVVIFREDNGELETLLIPRPEDDIVWPGMYHTPGTALRASDFERDDGNPLNGPFQRLADGELNSRFKDVPTFVGRLHRVSDRGPEVVEIYKAQLTEDLPPHRKHVWYPIERLAENPKFIKHQLEHVKMAVNAYLPES